MKYYNYCQVYYRNGEFYLYVGSHKQKDDEDFYQYKGSGVLLSDFEWVTKVALQYYATEEDMRNDEPRWIEEFARTYGVSTYTLTRYRNCVALNSQNFIDKYYSTTGRLLNCHNDTFNNTEFLSSVEVRQRAVDTMNKNETLCMGFKSNDSLQRRNKTKISKYGNAFGDLNKANQTKIERYGSINACMMESDKRIINLRNTLQSLDCRLKRTYFYILSNGMHGSREQLSKQLKLDMYELLKSRSQEYLLKKTGLYVVTRRKGSDFTDEEVQYCLNHLD